MLDGSSVELEARQLLCKAYPPGKNRHGPAHWPVLRIVVLHELETGLAEKPCWGLMNGTGAVSEQSLAEKTMEALAPRAVLVEIVISECFQLPGGEETRSESSRPADRRTGEETGRGAHQHRRGATRMLEAKPLRRASQGGMPPAAVVEGRLIAMRVGKGQSKEWLYLLPTLVLPPDRSPGPVQQALENRNRSALAETNRAATSGGCPQPKHDGKRTARCRSPLQSGSRRHGAGGAAP